MADSALGDFTIECFQKADIYSQSGVGAFCALMNSLQESAIPTGGGGAPFDVANL